MHALCLLGGVLLALWVPDFPQSALSWALGAAALLLVWLPRARVLLPAVAGFMLAQHALRAVLQTPCPNGERLLIETRIATIPVPADAGWQFDAWVRFPREPQRPPLRVRLAQSVPAPRPRAGERWQFIAQFAAPATRDLAPQQRRVLLRDHVSATARIIASPLDRRLAPAPASLDTLRERVAERIDARVADPSAAGLLAALAVGVTGDVADEQWRVFNATGITHLVAISGLHVTFFAVLSMAGARRLWPRLPGVRDCLRRESFAALIGVLLAVAYALLSGASVPAQRTMVMLTAFLLARECARATRALWSVATALSAVLLWDPLAALSAGFWLSFAAVAAIIVFCGGRLWPAGGLRDAARVQLVVSGALLPVTAMIFGTFSAIGPLVNAAAIPLFSFALVPPILVATALYLLPGAWMQSCADRLIDLAAWSAATAWPLLAAGANCVAALWRVQATTTWLLLALPAALAMLLPLPGAVRVTAALLLGGAFALREPRPAAGEVRIDVLDVGAAEAVLLRTRHHQLLYGLGETFGGAGRRFERRVLPRLQQQDYPLLDVLLPDRPGRDAYGALTIASARLPLARVLADATEGIAPELVACGGERWDWDGITFQVQPGQAGCGLVVRAGGRSIALLPEGIGASTGADGPAPVLLLPRRARAAALALGDVDVGGRCLLASISDAEWRSPAWTALAHDVALRGGSLLTTAEAGEIHLAMDARTVRILRFTPAALGYHAPPCGK